MISDTARYLRRLAAADPKFSTGTQLDDDVDVVNIDVIDEDDGGVVVYDLSDGTTVQISFSRYTR